MDAGRAAQLREEMVRDQLRGRGISDELLLAAMGWIPREAFVPADAADRAYRDEPLPIEAGQTISQPYMVGWMTQLLKAEPGMRALEVGTGSGYQAAVLAAMGCRVISVERHAALAEAARARLAGLAGLAGGVSLSERIRIVVADGSLGLPDEAPFERIIVTGPMVQIAREQLGMPLGVARALTEVIAGVGLGAFVPPGVDRRPPTAAPFEGNQLTSNRERYARAQAVLEAAPELALGPPTFGWMRAALRSCAMLSSLDYPASIKVPVLMVAAGRDTIVSTPVIEDFAPRMKLGTLALIGTSKHEILQESDDIRGRFWASFDAYVDAIRAAA